jgi:FAD/FMN-containing dehydrogenase
MARSVQPTEIDDYPARVEQIRAELAALPSGTKVRLRKQTSNLFRPREKSPGTLDAALFDGVISIDPIARTADVGGMTTYENLVAATLAHGLVPLVVPQLKTITLGGAVTGLGIESTSFRNGCPHESVVELDILTGGGDVVTARADNEHRELFFAFPNSFGSLGYALRLRIELEPVSAYVHLRHVRFPDAESAVTALARICAERSHDGEQVDFVDGTWFDADEVYLSLGAFADTAPYVSDYTGQQIFYRSIQNADAARITHDWLTTSDYLWRWDTDWFWCSRAFGAQNPRLRRVWPARWRRSDFYWKLIALNRRVHFAERLERWHGRPEREEVVQDIEVPIDRVPEFLRFLDETTGIEPVWMCPLRQRDPEVTWSLYPLDPEVTYVNIGFWSSVALPLGERDGFHNRAIERKVAALGGRKSLYSTSYYPPEEFWATYGGHTYTRVRATYDPDRRLLDLYDKTVARR